MQKVSKLRSILPNALALITGRPRYLPENMEWAPLWTSNLFRAFELVFWRAYGPNGIGDTIRVESSVAAQMIDGVLHVERQFFTFEALVSHAEAVVRAYFKKVFEPRAEFGFLPQPVFATLVLLGLKLSFSGDMHGLIAPVIGMAIAYDNSGTTHPTGSTTATVTFTTSGTDIAVCAGFTANKASIPAVNSITWAGAAMTAASLTPQSPPANATVREYIYYKTAAASGSNSLVVTFAATTDETSLNAVSYTGVGSVPQNNGGGNGTGTTATISITTTIDNSWLVGGVRNDNNGDGSAGSGTTKRSFVAGQNGFYDSGGAKTPAGSYSISSTFGSAGYAAVGISLAPPVVIANIADARVFFM